MAAKMQFIEKERLDFSRMY
ncbi:uncharacterized protein ARMOST_20799 [Armillaria ostoyae]|uniref:Uncharacterized protein n=1 Tax=Armillaria ostoyae TaxID=47428 RepID=A0A284S8C7_ARMOS|nr:uncharacterized protein ARMOST_20799 [Armillaria ostoyae]